MAREKIQTRLLGRTVKMNPAEQFQPNGPQAKYYERAGQTAEIVSVYLGIDGSPSYDLLFPDGKIMEGACTFTFTVQ